MSFINKVAEKGGGRHFVVVVSVANRQLMQSDAVFDTGNLCLPQSVTTNAIANNFFV